MPREVVRFVVVVVLIAAIIVAGGFFVLSREAVAEAQRNAEEIARVQGVGVVQPVLSDRLLQSDATAVEELDRIVRSRVLDARTVRVKIWDSTGRIVYSDEARLIGQTFPLGFDEEDALRRNVVDSSVSDLSRPENRFERPFGELLEVYLPIQTPTGTKVLFETYQEFASVQAEQGRMVFEFGSVLAGGLVLLLLLQAPLAWSMANRLGAASREREALLAHAVEASEGERRRIASDLHDGVVQRLAGTGMSLSAASSRFEGSASADADGTVATMRESAAQVREAVRELRTLIVKIAPSGLTAATLPEALRDLVEPLRAGGLETELRFDDCALDPDEARLVYRVVQEAVRNAARHSGASQLLIALEDRAGRRLLRVTDNGRGFEAGALRASSREGHVGLTLLRSLAEGGGASLEVQSAPGEGTVVEMRLP